MLNDDTCSLLLDILVNSSANPHVVRPVVLLLTEIANTHQTQPQTATSAVVPPAAPAAGDRGSGAGEETAIFVKAPPEGATEGGGVSGTTVTLVKADPAREPR